MFASVVNRIDMEKDEIFEMAERYVKATGRSVFLTGKAGTGKTTFLKYITQTTSKRFVVLAPTGVAAINAGGSTIHSFFQLPLCPYLPDVKELVTEYQMPDKYRSLRKERIKIIRTLDLLIIDEISMVRADLLDAVDMTLRRYRHNDKPFGGVQLLMIGDAQQLSPVVKEDERQYISQVYQSPYFFHSKALQKLPYITIELQKVHRQQDQEFVDILNGIRENRPSNQILKALNSRVKAYEDCDDVIRLTTHNAQANKINTMKLDELPGDAITFGADINGEFPENSYPADEVLSLKVGAQVMFIRNDSEAGFYNGKIGKVTDISSKGVVLVTDSNDQTIAVNPVEWTNSQYVLNDESGEIEQSIVGTFKQLPLRIAWAITIHKSQGLTFDKVIIDAGAAFAFGQVYVALSRCRTLEGISLDSPIRPSSIYSDNNIAEFNNFIQAGAQTVRDRLENEERGYKYDIYREIFDFEQICSGLGWVRKIWRDKLKDIYESELNGLVKRSGNLDQAKKVAETFRAQLSHIEAAQMPDETFLNERLNKASGYFLPTLEDLRGFCSKLALVNIDNKEVEKKLKEAMEELLPRLEIACNARDMISDGRFTLESYNKTKTECLLEERTSKARRLKKIEKEADEPGMVNEPLRERLQEWRTARFKKDNIPAFMIMHQSTLMEIASRIPKTKAELLKIKGFGEERFKKYGEDILAITAEF